MTLTLILLLGVLCLLAGFVIGVCYETAYGQTAKKRDEYFTIILRMITRLKEHYSSTDIYTNLIKDPYGAAND